MTPKTSTHIEKELAKFTLTDAAIAAMKKEYMPLSIKGIDDKDGYKEVHAARMVVKGKRIEIEKTRKELKKEALAFGRAVDGEAKRITEQLQGIESHLSDQQAAVDNEKERIKQEALELIRAKEEAERQAEIDRIARIEEAERLAREKVMAEEEARLKSERERQEKVEAEQRAKEAELKAAQDKIDAEKQAINDAKRLAADKIQRAAELEKAKKEAAEAARIEAEQKAEREVEEKAAAELKAKAEAERQEALKPDKEKLRTFGNLLYKLPLPMVTDAEAITIKAGIAKRLIKIVAYIEEFTDAK